ncbi:MAG: hypothetical protein ACREUU_20315, partial [Gammaproteobacteria bacterium]
MKPNILSHRASAFRALARTFLLGAILAGAAGRAIPSLGAEVRVWTGNASAFWSNPNNWTPAGTPQNGDLLRWLGSDNNTSMVNDIPNLIASELYFEDEDYTVAGNPLTITGPGVGGAIRLGGGSHTVTMNCPLVVPPGGERYQVWPNLG